MYESTVKAIVRKHGGFREKSILSKPHLIEKSETWNNEHKVLNVLSNKPDIDGYKNGFQIDLVTMSICG